MNGLIQQIKLNDKTLMVAALSIISFFAITNFFSPTLLVRFITIVALVLLFEFLLWKTREVKPFLPSAGLVSALIIFLLADPQTPLMLVLLAIVAAVGIKQFLRLKNRHIFNPAASGLFIASLFGLPVTWWGVSWGILPLVVIIVLAGYVSILRVGQGKIVAPFILISIVLSAVRAGNVLSQFTVGSLWFFALVMLPEPVTAAHKPNVRLLYGGLVAMLSFAIAFLGIPVESLLAPLLLGNLVVHIIEKIMNLDEFHRIVDEVVENLPKEFADKLHNVEITVDVWPTEQEMRSIRAHPGTLLFGLYRGVPHTQRGAHYSSLPDKIIIFAGPILSVSHDLEDAKRRIRSTVLHEIGHHFGMSEEEIRKAERKRTID